VSAKITEDSAFRNLVLLEEDRTRGPVSAPDETRRRMPERADRRHATTAGYPKIKKLRVAPREKTAPAFRAKATTATIPNTPAQIVSSFEKLTLAFNI